MCPCAWAHTHTHTHTHTQTHTHTHHFKFCSTTYKALKDLAPAYFTSLTCLYLVLFFKKKLFIYLFIYLWLCWVFVSVRGLSLVVASGGHSSSRCAGLSLSQPLLLRSTGSRRAGSVIVAHGPSCSAACGIFPDQGLNPCPLHWQADSQPLRHRGSPILSLFIHGDLLSDPQMCQILSHLSLFILQCLLWYTLFSNLFTDPFPILQLLIQISPPLRGLFHQLWLTPFSNQLFTLLLCVLFLIALSTWEYFVYSFLLVWYFPSSTKICTFKRLYSRFWNN